MRAYATIPGPKHYKLLGPLNDIFNLGSPDKYEVSQNWLNYVKEEARRMKW